MFKKIITVLTIVLLFNITAFITPFAQESQTFEQGDNSTMTEEELEAERQSLKKIEELENLLEIAKIAGFTKEELRTITIEKDDEKINVWDFIIQEKERMKLARKRMMAASNKRYFTVKDITEDLIKNESDQVKDLKSKLIFSGEKEE